MTIQSAERSRAAMLSDPTAHGTRLRGLAVSQLST